MGTKSQAEPVAALTKALEVDWRGSSIDGTHNLIYKVSHSLNGLSAKKVGGTNPRQKKIQNSRKML